MEKLPQQSFLPALLRGIWTVLKFVFNLILCVYLITFFASLFSDDDC